MIINDIMGLFSYGKPVRVGVSILLTLFPNGKIASSDDVCIFDAHHPDRVEATAVKVAKPAGMKCA
jgi:hypothetical protein